jgi:NPCBM/NEW2 domain-containing protein
MAMVRIALPGLVLTAAIGVLASGSVKAADEPTAPPHYVKKSTWEETMRSSREVLVTLERAAQRTTHPVAFSSEIVRGGERAQEISVPLAGEKELFLYVVGAPDTVWGAATWADAKLIGSDGSEVSVSKMKGLKILEGRHSIDVNMNSGVSGALSIAGQDFERGIHVFANSKVRVPLDGKYVRFEASIGIDDWVGQHGSVRFHVVGPEGAARLDLWTRAALDFSEETARRQMKWVRQDRILDADWEPGDYTALAKRYAEAAGRVFSLGREAAIQAIVTKNASGLRKVRDLYYRSRQLDDTLARAKELDFEALRLAIDDLAATFGRRYSGSQKYLARLSAIEQGLSRAISRTDRGELADFERVAKLTGDFDLLKSDALLANPLLNFKHLLLIRRVPHGDPRRAAGRGYGIGEYIGTPRQSSKCNPNIEEPFSWENEIAVLSPVRPDGTLTTFHKSEGGRLITDVDLNFDADKLLFSMPGSHDKWHVFELGTNGQEFRQLTPEDQPDVDYYDACYLPSGRIALVSTAPLQGVPCNAGVIVGMMYTMAADGSDIRQICFEQDHNYCPTVMNDGRIMYLRWDYTDMPHVWNRILFSTNPDGTGQAELYDSNSYWPNSVFFARCIPDHPTKLVGIVTGHHVGRVGELIIFDPARGRHETDGVVQRIPGRGHKVEPLIEDKLTEHSWPKFIHPYPLSEKHFITACKPTPDSLWGIYLVDTFDNMVLIKEEERHVLLEPIPYRRTRRPPVISN